MPSRSPRKPSGPRRTQPRPADPRLTHGQLGQTRAFAFGTIPSLHDLALAPFHTSNPRHWKIVTDALAAGVLPGEQIDGCVQFLATNYSVLPRYVQTRLKRLAPTLHA